jgi:hypothetical protein
MFVGQEPVIVPGIGEYGNWDYGPIDPFVSTTE